MEFFFCYRNAYRIVLIINVLSLVLCLKIGETANDIMTSLADNLNDTDKLPVQEIDNSKSIVLLCRSNDKQHLFMYWLLPKDDVIVGPANKFDSVKYDYEILSGNLTIRRVTKEEEGIYHCVSKGVHNNDVNIRSVRMVVNKPGSTESEINYFRGVVVVATLLVISGIVYGVYFMIKKRQKREILLETSSDDEDSGEEMFRAPGTSKQSDTVELIRSRELDDDDHIEIPKISIDFEDILQNSQK
ncbi:hypothetical protein RN001_004995 [Aquatica leii]|uniref:Ig-like domain-containing protein n=1 Tax=Aquatica leii TaxID=1421715 RepID=A0AAN7PJ69_9COLE|nr:hypothetical protein RN001_004995 [Aquatica leii]